MNIKLTFAALALAATTQASAAPYRYESVPGDPMQSRIYTLPNGLKVYLSVNKEAPRIAAYIAVRTGSRNDPAETTGLAHYLEHLMFKGTTHFGTSNAEAEAPLLDSIQNRYERYRLMTDPAQRRQAYHEIDSISQLAAQYNIPNEYDKMMAAIGANGTNAYTSNDVTCYTEDIPSNEIENWAKIQSDRFQNMVIRGFHTELEAVYEEFNISLTKDNRKMWSALGKKLFPTHPYGMQTTLGTQEHLKNPSITNIKNYYNRYYVPNNVAICMAGDFNPDEVMTVIDRYFGSWKKSETLSRPEFPAQPTYTEPVDTTVVGPEAEMINLAWKAPEASSYAADTLNVISEILANGKAGLMDENLNLPMKVQGAGAYYNGMHDYGQFILSGRPKQGQTLEEVRQLMLAEIEKLKKGQFSDKLLQAVVSNSKLQVNNSLLKNENRVDYFVDAFINEQPWTDVVGTINRLEGMKKEDIVAFANRFFTDGYVTVFKRKGEDTSVQKIDKPAITPIPTNADKQSDYLKAIVESKPKPIEPRFVDYEKDLTVSQVDKNTRMLYKQNTDDDLFTLSFDFPTGTETDNTLSPARSLLDYAGTAKLNANDLQKAFYELACDYSVSVGSNHVRFTLTGLNENMPQALRLFADLMENGRISKADYTQAVNLIEKMRNDAKSRQEQNFSALRAYGQYGAYNAFTNQTAIAQLRATDGNTLLKTLRNVRHQYPMTIMYFGKSTEKDVAKLVQKVYPRKNIGKQTLPTAKPYQAQPTTTTEVLLAPYDAKNIYMIQYQNADRQWTRENAGINALFNEYFGGSMNAIVFQELREARGLAYSASARYNTPWRKGESESFYTYIITQNDKMMDCINEFNNLLNNMPQREAAFELAKQSLLKSYATSRTTRFDILDSYMSAEDRGINFSVMEAAYKQIPSLKLQDLERFANERISNKPYRYVILGDEKSLDMESLGKLGPIRRLSTEQIFGY